MSQRLALRCGWRKVRVVLAHVDLRAVAALKGIEPLWLALLERCLQPFVAVAPLAVCDDPRGVGALFTVSAHPFEPFLCNCAASYRRPEQQRDSTGVDPLRQGLFSGGWLQAGLFVLVVDKLSELFFAECVVL